MNSAPPISGSRQLAGLAAWLLLTFAVAGLGAIASVDAGAFYAELVRPSWAPPGWVFGPVWSVLYGLMGVSAWLVWRRRAAAGARTALFLFVVQLGINALWSWLFFVWRQGALALADVLILWFLVLATVVAFRRFSGLAAALLWPYLAWVTFASALTFAVWRHNPGLLA